jgi:hypothetical protein
MVKTPDLREVDAVDAAFADDDENGSKSIAPAKPITPEEAQREVNRQSLAELLLRMSQLETTVLARLNELSDKQDAIMTSSERLEAKIDGIGTVVEAIRADLAAP